MTRPVLQQTLWPVPSRPALRPPPPSLGPAISHLGSRSARVTSCYSRFPNFLVASHLTQHKVHFLPQPTALTPSDLFLLRPWTPATSPPAPLQALRLPGLPGPPSRGDRLRSTFLVTHPSRPRALLATPSVTALVSYALPSPPSDMEAPGARGV